MLYFISECRVSNSQEFTGFLHLSVSITNLKDTLIVMDPKSDRFTSNQLTASLTSVTFMFKITKTEKMAVNRRVDTTKWVLK